MEVSLIVLFLNVANTLLDNQGDVLSTSLVVVRVRFHAGVEFELVDNFDIDICCLDAVED